MFCTEVVAVVDKNVTVFAVFFDHEPVYVATRKILALDEGGG